MKQNVLIVELLDTHYPLIASLMEVFKRNKKLNFNVWVTQKNYYLLKENFPNLVKQQKKKIFVLKTNKNYLNTTLFPIIKLIDSFKKMLSIRKIIIKTKSNIIFLNTIESKQNFFLLLYLFFSNKKVILTYHHNWNISKDLGRIYIFILKKMLLKSDLILVLGDYLKLNQILNKKKKLVMNYVYNTNSKKFKKFKKKTFVILGTAKIEHRDYEYVFKSFSKIINTNREKYLNKIQIIIAAKIHSKEIYDLIKKYNLKEYIKTFKEYINEQEYRRILLKSHYAIIPTYKDKKFAKDRIEASFAYSCEFHLPAILPKQYFLGCENVNWIKSCIIPYNFNDLSLKSVIKDCIEKEYKTEDIENKFKDYEKIYGINNVNKEINKLLLK